MNQLMPLAAAVILSITYIALNKAAGLPLWLAILVGTPLGFGVFLGAVWFAAAIGGGRGARPGH